MDEKEKKSEKGSSTGADASAAALKPVKKLDTGRIIFYAIIAGAVVFNIIVAAVLINVTRPKDVAEKEAEAKNDSLRATQERSTEIGGVSDPIEAVVNIAGTNGERFLKVVIRYEYDDKKFPKLTEEIKKRFPKLKDLLIERISPMTLTELNEPETRAKLRQDILRVSNNSMRPEDGEFRDVFIDQFIIQ
jgi:flagellar basal body-associated protein FliL